MSAREVYPSSPPPDAVEYGVATDDGSLGHRGFRDDLVHLTRAGRSGLRVRPEGMLRLSSPAGRGRRTGSASPVSRRTRRGPRGPDRSPPPAGRPSPGSMSQNMGCCRGACSLLRDGVSARPSVCGKTGLRERGTRLGGRCREGETRVMTGSGPRRRQGTPTARSIRRRSWRCRRNPGRDRSRGPAPPVNGAGRLDLPSILAADSSCPTRSSSLGDIRLWRGIRDVVEVDRLGAICAKGPQLKPRIGNPNASRDRDTRRDTELDVSA